MPLARRLVPRAPRTLRLDGVRRAVMLGSVAAIAFAIPACSDTPQSSNADSDASSQTPPTPPTPGSVDVTAPDAGAGDAARDARPDGHAHDHGDDEAERLVIADGESAKVHVFDVEEERLEGTFDLAGRARVYTGPTGRYVYAVQGDDDKVHVIDAALVIEDHGDHVHHERDKPRVLPNLLEGDYPIHFVAHAGKVGIFFDDDGVGQVFDEAKVEDAKIPVVRVDTGMPHHGVVVPLADAILASTPTMPPGGSRATPTGIDVYAATGAKTSTTFANCPSLHGEASNARGVAFGCADGVLFLEGNGATLRAQKIANPSSTAPRPPRVGTIVGRHGLPFFIGNYGADALCRIDLDGAGTMTPFAAPARVGFDLDHAGRRVLVLGRDGRLSIFDAATGTAEGDVEATSPVTDDSGHGAKHPQFAVGREWVYVTDPARSRVVAVDIVKRAVVKTWAISAAPTKIAVAHFPHAH